MFLAARGPSIVKWAAGRDWYFRVRVHLKVSIACVRISGAIVLTIGVGLELFAQSSVINHSLHQRRRHKHHIDQGKDEKTTNLHLNFLS